MTEEQRILDGAGTSFEQALLQSARNEVATEALQSRMMAPFVIPPALVSPTTAGAGASVGASVKWGLMTAGILGLVGAVSFGVSESKTLDDSAAGASARLDAEQPQAGKSEKQGVLNADTDPTVSKTEAPAEAPPASPANKSARTSVSSLNVPSKARAAGAGSSTLEAEVKLLEQARSALAAHDPKSALFALLAYEKKYPEGVLRQEATVLRVTALKAQGSSAEAESLKQDFLKQNPSSAHKKRLDEESQEPNSP